MPDVSSIELSGSTFRIKDETARQALDGIGISGGTVFAGGNTYSSTLAPGTAQINGVPIVCVQTDALGKTTSIALGTDDVGKADTAKLEARWNFAEIHLIDENGVDRTMVSGRWPGTASICGRDITLTGNYIDVFGRTVGIPYVALRETGGYKELYVDADYAVIHGVTLTQSATVSGIDNLTVDYDTTHIVTKEYFDETVGEINTLLDEILS